MATRLDSLDHGGPHCTEEWQELGRPMGGLPSITIEVLSKHSSVDEATIRGYQRLGLVRKPRTVVTGLSLYSPDDIDRVRFIKSALNLGFEPAAIRELLDLADHKGMECHKVKEIAERHLRDLYSRITELQRMVSALKPLVSECASDMTISECPIVEALRAGADLRPSIARLAASAQD